MILFGKKGYDGQQLYMPVDAHLNTQDHEVFADALYNYLKSKDLL